MFRPSGQPAPAPADASCADDAALVRLFVDDNSEPAFAELVRRHGPMVLQVCRRALANRQDAEDAFQLTFLVLAKKASQLHQPQLVGNWLYGVAVNVSRRARTAASRRRAAEAHMTRPAATTRQDPGSTHLQHLIDQEIPRLPAKYRAAIVACYLQGQTNRDAARALGWPVGTLVTRLNRGKAALRVRVAARLKQETDTALTAALNRRSAPAAVPLALLASTLRTARRLNRIPHPPHPRPASPRPATPTSTRPALGKFHAVGVSFSVALTTIGACLAFGSIHHTAPAQATAASEPKPDPDRRTLMAPHANPASSPIVAPAADARALSDALTQANRDILPKPAPRSLHR